MEQSFTRGAALWLSQYAGSSKSGAVTGFSLAAKGAMLTVTFTV
jgi:hypothetical protein